jgi:hypothetical protein
MPGVKRTNALPILAIGAGFGRYDELVNLEFDLKVLNGVHAGEVFGFWQETGRERFFIIREIQTVIAAADRGWGCPLFE